MTYISCDLRLKVNEFHGLQVLEELPLLPTIKNDMQNTYKVFGQSLLERIALLISLRILLNVMP